MTRTDMSLEKEVLKRGQFYFIYNGDDQNFALEDRTKRGLPVVENNIDESVGIMAEKGQFYDGWDRKFIPPVLNSIKEHNIQVRAAVGLFSSVIAYDSNPTCVFINF